MLLTQLLNQSFPGAVGATMYSYYVQKYVPWSKQQNNPRQMFIFMATITHAIDSNSFANPSMR